MKKMIIRSSFMLLVFILIIVDSYFALILFGNYTIDDKQFVLNESTEIVDSDGELITKLYIEDRQTVSLEQIPEHVLEAFLAVEDHRFYDHHGIDFIATGRAIYRDIISRSKAEGGSTITQQLTKNTFLTHEKSWTRKIKEILIAVNLEQRYSKEEILEMYLNRIYFGHGAHGIQSAANLYFNKDVSDLNVEEGALLASLPKGPNLYSPFLDQEKSKGRRDLVLSLMAQHDFISAEEAVRLQGRTIPVDQIKITEEVAYLSYIDLVLEEIVDIYGITENEILRGGYTIEVAMDQELQKKSYEKLQDEVLFSSENGLQHAEGSMVFLDNESGGVLAVHGGREYVRKGYHRAITKRQPGSTLKPVAVYAPAMEEGLFEPFSILSNESQSFDGYEPRNIDAAQDEKILMYDAIVTSANIAAVWTLDQIGIQTGINYLKEQNVHLPDAGLSVALGGLSEGITPIELANLYRTFANEGYYSDPFLVKNLTGRSGETIERQTIDRRQVYSKQTAWNMTRMLEAVMQEGTGQAGNFNGAIAGKTGTTNGNKDLWFAGYTPTISGAVWLGYDTTNEDQNVKGTSALAVRSFKESIMETGKTDVDSAFILPNEVEDISSPIRLTEIHNLSADVSIGFRGLHVKLDWDGAADKRIHYRIYHDQKGEKVLIDEVEGVTEYSVYGGNIFQNQIFEVVPYNPQLDEEGETPLTVEAKYSFFSVR